MGELDLVAVADALNERLDTRNRGTFQDDRGRLYTETVVIGRQNLRSRIIAIDQPDVVLGVRPEDARWAQMEADALASLIQPAMRIRLPAAVERLWRRVARWIR